MTALEDFDEVENFEEATLAQLQALVARLAATAEAQRAAVTHANAHDRALYAFARDLAKVLERSLSGW